MLNDSSSLGQAFLGQAKSGKQSLFTHCIYRVFTGDIKATKIIKIEDEA